MKISIQHVGLPTTDRLDSLVETQILALETQIVIEEARVRLEHVAGSSPAYKTTVELVTPGPDLFASCGDHTIEAAVGKTLAEIGKKIRYKQGRQHRRVSSNLQAPSSTRFPRAKGSQLRSAPVAKR